MATLIPLAPTGSDGGAFDAAAGDSLTLPGLSAEEWAKLVLAIDRATYEPSRLWVKLRLEDANEAFADNNLDKARLATDLADGMMRYLELRQREEAAS